MTARRSRGYASRLHEIREDTRRAAKDRRDRPDDGDDRPDDETSSLVVQAVPGDASGTDHVYCTDYTAHQRFHRRLQGHVWTCCLCGPEPGDS